MRALLAQGMLVSVGSILVVRPSVRQFVAPLVVAFVPPEVSEALRTNRVLGQQPSKAILVAERPSHVGRAGVGLWAHRRV